MGEVFACRRIEIVEAGDDDDGGGDTVGDLDEIADRLLESLLRIVEEAQVLHLIDAEDERRAIDRLHQPAEAFDDLEGAVLTLQMLERTDERLPDLVDGTAIEILAHPLIDSGIIALEIEQRADDIDVEILPGEFRRRNDLIGETGDEVGELFALDGELFQKFARAWRQNAGAADEMVRQTHQPGLDRIARVIGFLERVDETAQEVFGIVANVRRHLRIAEIAAMRGMGAAAECADQVRLAGARMAMEQQDTILRGRATLRDGGEQLLEFPARQGVHLRHVERVGLPNIVLPGDRMLEHTEKALVGDRLQRLWQHHASSTLIRCQIVFW